MSINLKFKYFISPQRKNCIFLKLLYEPFATDSKVTAATIKFFFVACTFLLEIFVADLLPVPRVNLALFGSGVVLATRLVNISANGSLSAAVMVVCFFSSSKSSKVLAV